MRKLNSNFFLRTFFVSTFLFLLGQLAEAQVPPYYNHSPTAGVNNFPFNANAAVGKRIQWVIAAGEMSQPTPLGSGNNITQWWIKASAASTATYNNLTIRFATVPTSTFISTGQWYTGPMTTVFTAPTHQVATSAQGWYPITLTTPYLYDPTMNFIVEVYHCGYTGTGFGVPQAGLGAAPNFRRQYSDASSACGVTPLTTGGDLNVAGIGFTVIPAVACPAPTAQPTNLVLTATGLQQINGSFTAAAPPATNYLVVRYPNAAVPTAPVNGTSYTVGSSLGAGTIVANGTGTTFSATGLSPGTTYNFYVYSFNSGLCSNTYMTTAPLTGTQTTLPCPGPPVITCPANITTNNTAGFCGANVTYPAATATGTPTPTITYSIPSGSFFPVGTTTVTATATSICGTANCTFTITVNDTQGPTFTSSVWPDRFYYKFDGSGATVPNLATAPPAGTASGTLNGLTQGGTGKCGTALIGTGVGGQNMNTGWTTVNLSTPWTISFWLGGGQVDRNPSYLFGDINSGGFRAFYGGAALANNMLLRGGSGDVLITGVNPAATYITIVYTGTNTIVYKNGASPQTYAVTFANSGTGPFLVGGYGTTQFSMSGAMDEWSMHSRALSAAEVATLFAACPTTPNSCPSNITASNTPGQCSAVVTYTTPVGTDNCPGSVTTTQVAGLPSGSTFPVGLTTNTFRATDGAGNITNCTFTVRVNDTQAPTITCPANMTVSTPVGSCTAVVTYTPTVTDNCSGATFIATPASGSVFNLGTTPVTVIATDASGNTSTCTFNVTVNDGQLPVMSAPPTNRTVCNGTNAVFSVTSSNVLSYQWQSFNGTAFVNIPGANSSTYTVSNVTPAMNTNSYRVVLTGLCTTVTSQHVSLFVNNLPTVALTASRPPQLLPGEFVNINATTNPSGGTYVWYKNGVIITGVSGSSLSNYTVNNAGTYRVVYTDANGCVSTSGDLVLSALSSDNLYVYPNPNRGDFRVRFNNVSNENVTVNVYDAKGSKIYSRQYTTGLTYSELDVSMKKLSIGRYLVEAVNGSGARVGAKWVIIER